MIDYELIAQLYPCEIGANDTCCYHDHDDELCKKCIRDMIHHLKKCLKKLKQNKKEVN